MHSPDYTQLSEFGNKLRAMRQCMALNLFAPPVRTEAAVCPATPEAIRKPFRKVSRSLFHNSYRFADSYRNLDGDRLSLTEEECQDGAGCTEDTGQNE